MRAQEIVDHFLLRDKLGRADNKVLDTVGLQQLAGSTVTDAAEHFAEHRQGHHIRILSKQVFVFDSSHVFKLLFRICQRRKIDMK